MRNFLWAVLAAAGLSATAQDGDWPGFLGPERTGVSPETGLLRQWPPEGPQALWTAAVGPGFAGPAVRDGLVFLLDRAGNDRDLLRCLDLATGKPVWELGLEAPGRMQYSGSRNTPLVTDEHLYLLGPLGHLTCVDRKMRKAVWSKDLFREFQPRTPPPEEHKRFFAVPQWGMTRHPVLYKDLLIVATLLPEAGLVALDRATGEVKWKSKTLAQGFFAHSAPCLATLCGVDQIVVVSNTRVDRNPPATLSGVEAATGKVLWSLETWKRYNVPIPSPVNLGGDRVFIAGGYTLGAGILQVSRPDGAWKTDFAVKDLADCTPHIHTPILYREHLYVQSFDGFHNRGVNSGLMCLDLEGKTKWKSAPERLFDSGGLLIADGLLFVLHGRTGELFLIEAQPDRYRELAKAKVLGAKVQDPNIKQADGLVWAPLALSGGKLLVRDQQQLKCLDVRGKQITP